MWTTDDELEVRRLREMGQRWLRHGELPNTSTSTTSGFVKPYEWNMAMDCFMAANRIESRRNEHTA